ncbi:hypothetical protein GQX73_g4673 [Xylaria multiplex]|uniref:Uncharacterized protein n=1 Tax=Xylaria multiplex TaxID=323545 RepID=A0A7C8MRW2_9PEZI|nr:hypothetical protein GQX73_g4673 [Xylaria multiplex]
MADEPNSTDWISASASLAATIIGVMTLLTVYVGAMQILSENRMYRHGLSWRSLGPWQAMVAKRTLFGLQRHISTPRVNIKLLIQKEWDPLRLTFPLGFPRSKDVEKADNVQAKASWVNFMQALNLSPTERRDEYEIQDASELVNGIVPMHWTGKDLVGICSILGFQSHEDKPSFVSPMSLPMQWSGPLGWLQFRASANGCVAEFRRRMELHNQISAGVHSYYKPQLSLSGSPDALRSRLWNSISGFALDKNETLFLGGAARKRRPQEDEDEEEATDDQMFRELMSKDMPQEDIMRKLFGKSESRPKALRREVERNASGMSRRTAHRLDNDIPDFLDAVMHDEMDSSDRKQVLRTCDGLLSVTVQGELAYSRGLSVKDCYEYDRKYTVAEDIDKNIYPYNLGDLYMDEELLGLMKRALLLLLPDGFYFSPGQYLYCDLCEVYQHIEDLSNARKKIFPESFIEERAEKEISLKQAATTSSSTPSSTASPSPNDKLVDKGVDGVIKCIANSMKLCNELQETRKKKRACFSVDDMQLMAKAAALLLSVAGEQDLVWAVLYCPTISSDVLKQLEMEDVETFLDIIVTVRDCVIYCGPWTADGEPTTDENTWHRRYDNVPFVADGSFTGKQLVAAVTIVFITYYWIEKRWNTDVAAYDMTMPQSVLMC